MSILAIPLYLLIKKRIIIHDLIKKNISVQEMERIPFVFIVSLAIITSFIFLTKYPFVSIYDQVRDGGLNAMEIANGSLQNIFGYGRYESHGLILPVITSFFYLIFKNSVFTFRFPGALISVFDVIILYATVKKSINKQTAFWSSLTLLILPLHLYYSRTEIVVIFSSIFMSLILLLLSYYLKNRRTEYYVLFGILLGFSSGFHTSIRTVAVITIILIFILNSYEIVIKKVKKRVFLSLILMIIFYLIGFGPRILFTTPDIFFQTRSFSFNNNSSKMKVNLSEKIKNIGINYEKSLLVYFAQPTMSTHYADFKPILNPILGVLFIIGVIYSLFFSKNKFLKYICFFALIIPLTNSAITEAVNSDNRLAPMLPISAIFVGLGINLIMSKIQTILRVKKQSWLFIKIVLVLYFIFLDISFFVNGSASKQYGNQDYLSMHTVYFIKSNVRYNNSSSICFFTSPATFDYFKLMHVQEQYQYFVPNKYIEIMENKSIPDNQIYLSNTCNQDLSSYNYRRYNPCLNNEKFICPKDSKITIQAEIDKTKTYNRLHNTLFSNFILINPRPLIIP